MNTQAKCPQCGTTLPGGALEGLCPACLLKQGATADSASQTGQPHFVALPVPEVAKLFPQLEILGLIGQGGMGAIYKARQTALDRLVAVKSALPYSEAAAALGIHEAAARVAVHRLRRRYRELLREEVAQTLAHPEQVGEEMRALLGSFAG